MGLLYTYFFIMWDGIGFFGFAFYKLGRLRGSKPNICTKFADPVWVCQNSIILITTAAILLINFMGSQSGKLAGIEYIEQPSFTFKVDEQMFLLAHVQMSQADVLRIFQLYQDELERENEKRIEEERLKDIE